MGIRAYKGFNKDMTCRGFRFKEGETYTEEKAELCNSGFHACEHPLGCFSYYKDDVWYTLKDGEFIEAEE